MIAAGRRQILRNGTRKGGERGEIRFAYDEQDEAATHNHDEPEVALVAGAHAQQSLVDVSEGREWRSRNQTLKTTSLEEVPGVLEMRGIRVEVPPGPVG